MEKSVHPTAIMLTSTVNLLKTLSLSSGIHAEVMQVDAISTLCGQLRILVESGANDKTGILFNLFFQLYQMIKCHTVVRHLIYRGSFQNIKFKPYSSFSSLGCSSHKLVSREQHRSWCTLGFIRSIALMPQMCSTLSTSAWINLLIRIVEGHQSFTAVTLQRQVPALCSGFIQHLI